MEMRCFRKVLRLSYKDHITNEEISVGVRQAIDPYKALLTTVEKRKLKWYGHVKIVRAIAKSKLQETVQGGRERGRQRKRWRDNIKDWTDVSFAETRRLTEYRQRWRDLLNCEVRTLVAPQRSPSPRDWCMTIMMTIYPSPDISVIIAVYSNRKHR